MYREIGSAPTYPQQAPSATLKDSATFILYIPKGEQTKKNIVVCITPI